MKIKCRKISGVEKNICTCEQKIAYNYAFSWCDTYKRKVKECTTEIQKSEVFQNIIDIITKDVLQRKDMEKYNTDAIIISFRQGFIDYCNNFFIASNYKKIGEVFKIPYEII